MKCPSCGAEMIRMISMKRKYGENTYLCPNIRYHKTDAQKRAIMLTCER